MSRTGVSAIIPAYNAAAYIEEAVESVLHQTYSDIETIVVNDGSTDDTARILERYGNRIKVIGQPNRGQPAARNVGALAARGEWLAFLDADDVWAPEKTAHQLAAVTPDTQLIYTDRINIGAKGDLPEVQSMIQPLYCGDVFLDLLVKGNIITASSVMIRHSRFVAEGGFFEQVAGTEDWDLWIRVAEHHAIQVCPEPLVSYRFHTSMTSRNVPRMWAARCQVIQRALGLPRARAYGEGLRRRIWSQTWITNACEANRSGQHRKAAVAFLQAARYWPFGSTPYRELVRLAIGRA